MFDFDLFSKYIIYREIIGKYYTKFVP